MKQFEFKMPTKVKFGVGITAQLGEILKEQGYKKAMIGIGIHLSKTPVLQTVKDALEKADFPYVVYDEMIPDPTIEQIDEASDFLKGSGADVVVAVGGGSSMDNSKAICMLQTNEGSVRDYLFGGTKTVTNPIMPLICLPTTAGSGSEVTASSVVTNIQEQIKLSVTHEYLIPKLAVIDPLLHVGLSPFTTATTGMDALTHAIEAYTSLNAQPMSDALALYAIKLISENLRTATADGSNVQARSNMAIASTLAGAAFVNGGLGVVHGIAQSMGGVANVSHGAANALILPYAMRRNLVGNLEKFKNIAVAMGENIDGLTLREAAWLSADAVMQLAQDTYIPLKLTDPKIGITRDMFPKIIEGTMAYRLLAINPCKLNEKDVADILEAAYE
ncbi:MAG TPA: iron-containing alcohol dehydrogenase [Anaerovoracaceae bacterium]|nr:iron-containing alcohol dehydrogenase [Anaerovoracaceae bacterium]